MNIPFVDLKKQYMSIKTEIDNAIQSVINDTAFIKGKFVAKFEKDFKNAYKTKHVISCANGTDAIYIALKALGIGEGDEVITVANTWISTSETISQTGAKPIFVDIDPEFYLIDIDLIESKITKKTKAIIPVHLYGQPVNMDALKKICNQYNLYMIEDCAQAHFAEWRGQKVGTFGDIGTFSFFPGKNLGAYGDAGAVITNNDRLAEKMRMFANHGALIKHQHEIEGINSRMDGVQAAILSVKLKYILDWTKKRIQVASYYSEFLENEKSIILPKINKYAKHVFHLYVVRVDNRQEIIDALHNLGVQTGIHYPTPLPFLKAYQYLEAKSTDFPVSYNFQNKILSLPMYPELSKKNIQKICLAMKSFF